MKTASMVCRPIVSIAVVITLSVAVARSPQTAAAESLFLTGYNANYFDNPAMASPTSLSKATLCGPDGVNAFLAAMSVVQDRIGGRFEGSSPASAAQLQSEAQQARDDLCSGKESFELDAHAITYASCRMTMDTPSMLMDLRLPSGDLDGSMEISNFDDAKIMRIPMYQSTGAAVTDAKLAESPINWSGPGDSKQIAGYPATRWGYNYTMTMGMGGAQSMGIKISMVSDGHGYFAKNIPGFKVLEEFYEAFSKEVSLEKEKTSMFAGLLNTLVEMLDKGLPLETDQTVTSNFSGMSMGGNRSFMKVTGLRLAALSPDFCTRPLAPEHFAVTDIDTGMMGMTISTGDQPSGEEEGATGLGALMQMFNPDKQQDLGPGSTQQAPAANPAAQAAGASAAVGAMPSSEELYSDNMTQMAQRHLQALGYDPGDTSGELTTGTIIAISQFQAEHGLEVTGEVSPQLIGILSAEVDKRR